MPGLTLPPFPDNVPSHPLLVIDFNLIKAGDEKEIDRLWEAATGLGFWYLKNHGADALVGAMFDMGEEVLSQPMDEKLKYSETNLQTEQGFGSFGYKAAGEFIVDEKGTPDTIEYINVSKDDILAFPKVVHRTYPPIVIEHMATTLKPFLNKALDVNLTLISVFEKRLGLPTGALLKCHSRDEHSGSVARVLRTPARIANDKVSLGSHTDFGSLAFLHNRLGGLQVLPPGSPTWQYVRPLPGHAICNIGDTLTLLSGGILHSNMHRVVAPPGAQYDYPRWSMVYHTRPGKGVKVQPLVEESEMIREAVERMQPEQREKFNPKATAGEWYARRVKHLRTSDTKGREGWDASRGMEYRPEVI